MMEWANEGAAMPQHFVGMLYSLGQGVPLDMAEAARWWRKSADQGYPEAQLSLGTLYVSGNGVARDLGTAERWLRKAAEQGNPAAQFSLGVLYLAPGGLQRGAAEGMKWIRSAAERGHLPAQFSLGSSLYIGIHVGRDLTEAAVWLRKAAERNDAIAQFKLGVMHLRGEGVAQSPGEAAKWLRKASERGIAPAMSILAHMLLTGSGQAPNRVEAAKWLRLAAECGDPVAQDLLRRTGMPVPEAVPPRSLSAGGPPASEANAGASLHALERLADDGVAAAQFALGELCFKGGTQHGDRPNALEWFRRAAAGGHPGAQFKVALMMHQDSGSVSVDEAIGRFFQMAVSGNIDACRLLAQYLAVSVPDKGAGRELLLMSLMTTIPDERFFHKAVCRLCLGYSSKSGAFGPQPGP